ncbi:DoxX family protein [bacterium]|nr:DoxX family protein [bacterium]
MGLTYCFYISEESATPVSLVLRSKKLTVSQEKQPISKSHLSRYYLSVAVFGPRRLITMAIKLNKPVGNSLYGPLLLRQALGWYLLLAGVLKLENISYYAEEMQQLNALPEHIATLYAIILPYGEILAGGLLILGFLTTLGSMLAAFYFCSTIYFFGFYSASGQLLSKDIVMLACAISVMYSGAGALSIDRFRETG